MSQTGNDYLGSMLSGLSQTAAGIDSLIAELHKQTTPEILSKLDSEKRSEIERLKAQLEVEGSKVKESTDKAMAAATDTLRKAGFGI